jgi:hypothetical protein
MKTRLVLVLSDDSVTAEINAAIGEAIKAEGAGWWHWYQHTWLISDSRGRDAAWWRDRLQSVNPRPAFMIFGTTEQWAGFTKTEYYEWMHSTWDRSE